MCIVIIIQLSMILSSMNPKCLLWLYNKALIDQLVRSIRENIWTLAFRTDLTSFGPYFRTAVQIFPVWTSQLVNKSIYLSLSFSYGPHFIRSVL